MLRRSACHSATTVARRRTPRGRTPGPGVAEHGQPAARFSLECPLRRSGTSWHPRQPACRNADSSSNFLLLAGCKGLLDGGLAECEGLATARAARRFSFTACRIRPPTFPPRTPYREP